MVPTLLIVNASEFLEELTQRPPNVDLTLRVALRKPYLKGQAAAMNLFVTASYVRDIGPITDAFRTLMVVKFDHLVGPLTGTNQDSVTRREGEKLFNLLTARAEALNLQLAKGYYA